MLFAETLIMALVFLLTHLLHVHTCSETRRRIEVDARDLKLWRWECEDDTGRRGLPGQTAAADVGRWCTMYDGAG